jgi:hypothetical protein
LPVVPRDRSPWRHSVHGSGAWLREISAPQHQLARHLALLDMACPPAAQLQEARATFERQHEALQRAGTATPHSNAERSSHPAGTDPMDIELECAAGDTVQIRFEHQGIHIMPLNPSRTA